MLEGRALGRTKSQVDIRARGEVRARRELEQRKKRLRKREGTKTNGVACRYVQGQVQGGRIAGCTGWSKLRWLCVDNKM